MRSRLSFLCAGLEAKKIMNILIKICFTKARVVTSPFLFLLQVRVYSWVTRVATRVFCWTSGRAGKPKALAPLTCTPGPQPRCSRPLPSTRRTALSSLPRPLPFPRGPMSERSTGLSCPGLPTADHCRHTQPVRGAEMSKPYPCKEWLIGLIRSHLPDSQFVLL